MLLPFVAAKRFCSFPPPPPPPPPRSVEPSFSFLFPRCYPNSRSQARSQRRRHDSRVSRHPHRALSFLTRFRRCLSLSLSPLLGITSRFELSSLSVSRGAPDGHSKECRRAVIAHAVSPSPPPPPPLLSTLLRSRSNLRILSPGLENAAVSRG